MAIGLRLRWMGGWMEGEKWMVHSTVVKQTVVSTDHSLKVHLRILNPTILGQAQQIQEYANNNNCKRKNYTPTVLCTCDKIDIPSLKI